MEVDPQGDGPRLEHAGRSFWFCSEHCLHRFQAEPGTYADKTRRPDVATAPVQGEEAVEYTCPMHPEIRQLGPGPCPICGMALETRWCVSAMSRTIARSRPGVNAFAPHSPGTAQTAEPAD